MLNWNEGVACCVAGLLLANGVPHFVKGVCGDRFPTPFAKPPGKGLSSAPVNVAWGIFNLSAGLWLAHAGQLWCGSDTGRWLAGVAAAALSLGASWRFAGKDKE